MWTIFSRKSGGATVDGPSHTIFFWLIGAFILSILPHMTQMPTWLTVSVLLAAVVRCVAEVRRWPLPTSTSTGVVALCLLGAMLLQFHTVLGREAGTPFMAGLLAIKFYELRGPRDITLIIFSTYFVVMSALLFSQAVELFIYCLIMMWLLTGILLRTYMGDRPDCRLLTMLWRSSAIFLQALPLALLLFFFFPRYSGHFAMTFNDTVTGLSDHVEPGSIAELSNDDSPAMRVYFDKGATVPMPESMYWRAIVLWYFDGKGWWRGAPVARNETLYADAPLLEKQMPVALIPSDKIRQRIVLWPQNQRWIPALDRPLHFAVNADDLKQWSITLIGDVLVPAEFKVVDYKRQYIVTSSAITTEPEISRAERAFATELPAVNPHIKELADQLYSQNHETTAYRDAILHYFRHNGFQLSTEPGRLGNDPVGEFLFQTKIGFCEHYASAFAVLMREEHIPTRVVIGYRGGESISFSSQPVYLVTQSNAHAWDEIWIDGKKPHWERVDPTNAITAGTSIALAANEGLAADNDDLSVDIGNRRWTLLPAKLLPKWVRASARDFAMRRQEMEAQWDDWVFSYDPSTQDQLAQQFGLGKYAWILLLVGCCGALGLIAWVVSWFLARKKSLSPIEDFYNRLCRRMAQRGAPREVWEGPIDYTTRLAKKFPSQQQRIETAGAIVAEYRYGAGERRPAGDLEALLQDISKDA